MIWPSHVCLHSVHVCLDFPWEQVTRPYCSLEFVVDL